MEGVSCQDTCGALRGHDYGIGEGGEGEITWQLPAGRHWLGLCRLWVSFYIEYSVLFRPFSFSLSRVGLHIIGNLDETYL